jgi:hypothetical protein
MTARLSSICCSTTRRTASSRDSLGSPGLDLGATSRSWPYPKIRFSWALGPFCRSLLEIHQRRGRQRPPPAENSGTATASHSSAALTAFHALPVGVAGTFRTALGRYKIPVAAALFANGTGTIAVTAALLATNTRNLQSIRHLSPDVEHRTMGAKGSNANAIASKPRLPGYPLDWPLSGNLRRLSAGVCFPVANGRKQSLSQRSSHGRDKCPYHPAVLRVRYAQKVTCNRRDYSIEKTTLKDWLAPAAAGPGQQT